MKRLKSEQERAEASLLANYCDCMITIWDARCMWVELGFAFVAMCAMAIGFPITALIMAIHQKREARRTLAYWTRMTTGDVGDNAG